MLPDGFLCMVWMCAAPADALRLLCRQHRDTGSNVRQTDGHGRHVAAARAAGRSCPPFAARVVSCCVGQRPRAPCQPHVAIRHGHGRGFGCHCARPRNPSSERPVPPSWAPSSGLSRAVTNAPNGGCCGAGRAAPNPPYSPLIRAPTRIPRRLRTTVAGGVAADLPQDRGRETACSLGAAAMHAFCQACRVRAAELAARPRPMLWLVADAIYPPNLQSAPPTFWSPQTTCPESNTARACRAHPNSTLRGRN